MIELLYLMFCVGSALAGVELMAGTNRKTALQVLASGGIGALITLVIEALQSEEVPWFLAIVGVVFGIAMGLFYGIVRRTVMRMRNQHAVGGV